MTTRNMIDPAAARRFLAQPRIALVGASNDPKSFGHTIYRELRAHGNNVVAVNSHATTVQGDPCYPDLASVPGELDGVILMVHRDKAGDVVRTCAERGVPRVWLFKGLSGAGAVSDAAVRLCHQHGIEVIAGACPLMFLEPVGWIHRIHRAIRHSNGSLAKPT